MRAAAARAMGVEPKMFSSFPFCVRARSRDVLLEAHRLGVQRCAPARESSRSDDARDERHAGVAGGERLRDRDRHDAEDIFLEAARHDDFIGVQNYARQRYGPEGMLPPEMGVEFTQMGYEFCPEALEATIRYASATTQLPIIVTENGVATDDDTRRIAFVKRAMAGVARCLSDKIDVRGYFYWTAFDNFEWLFGIPSQIRIDRGRPRNAAPHSQAERRVVGPHRARQRDLAVSTPMVLCGAQPLRILTLTCVCEANLLHCYL